MAFFFLSLTDKKNRRTDTKLERPSKAKHIASGISSFEVKLKKINSADYVAMG